MQTEGQNLTGWCLIPTVTGYQASSCARDPNWEHPSTGPPLIYHQPALVHQSESAPVSLSISLPFQSRRPFASQEMMRVRLRNYSWGRISQREQADSDETSAARSDERVPPSLSMAL